MGIPSRDAEDRDTYTDQAFDPVGFASHKTFESEGIEGLMDPRLLRVEAWRPDTHVYRHYVTPESFRSGETHGEWTSQPRGQGAIADIPRVVAPGAPAGAPRREADSPALGAPPPGAGAVNPNYRAYHDSVGWEWVAPAERGLPPARAPDAGGGYGAQDQQRHGSPGGGGATEEPPEWPPEWGPDGRSGRRSDWSDGRSDSDLARAVAAAFRARVEEQGRSSWSGAEWGAGRAGTPAARHPDAASSSSSSADRGNWGYGSHPGGYTEGRTGSAEPAPAGPAPPVEVEAERGAGGEGIPSRAGPTADEGGGGAVKGGKTWHMTRERETVKKRRTTGEGATKVVEEEGIERVREEISGAEHFAAVVPAGGGYTGVVAVARQVWPGVSSRDQELVRRFRAREPLGKAETARVGPLVALEDGPEPSGFAGIGIPPQFRIPPAPL